MARPRFDIPMPNYERDVNEAKRIYRNAINEVLSIIESLSTYGTDRTISQDQMNSVLGQLSVLLRDVDMEAEEWVKQRIRESFVNGQAETLVAIGEVETLEEARNQASMSELITTTIDAIISDTFEDLFYANNKMKRETVKMVRSVVSENLKTQVAAGMGRNTTRKAIIEALTKKEIRKRFGVEGNIAIIDRLGRRWKLETYAEMITRTKLLQAHVEGTRTEALERDVDLAIISSHNATDPCSDYEGQIISMNGYTKGFITYEELSRSNLIFHPNCKHKVTPIRDMSLLPDDVREKFEDGRKKAQNELKKVKNR